MESVQNRWEQRHLGGPQWRAMTMMVARSVLATVALFSSPLSAQTISPHPDSVTVTLYHEGAVDTASMSRPGNRYYAVHDGLAFITETRSIDLPAGPATIEFRDVASTMVPQTADIQGLPANALERNFDYDLLSPGSLLAKSIGETVHLLRTDRDTGKQSEQTAIVRSGPDGVMLEIDGKLEALGCSGLPEKLVFAKLPDGLRDTPTLSARIVSPQAGHYTVKLSYIATGLNWSADYIARIHPSGHTLDLSGWITLANFSETGFKNAPVEVVAGNVATTGEDAPVDPKSVTMNTQCWPTNINWAKIRSLFADAVTASPQMEMKMPPAPPTGSVETVVVTGSRIAATRLGDYKLYALPERTTLAARQTKQVQFLDQEDIPFERIYTYVVDPGGADSQNAEATSVLRLQNKESEGLGKPLPAGTVSVTSTDANGSAVLAGQRGISDTSVGLPLEIETGRAMNVRVERLVTKRETSGSDKDKRTRLDYEITIENDKTIPIALELIHPLGDSGAQITAEDMPHTIKPAGATWTFALAPGQREVLHYTVEQPD